MNTFRFVKRFVRLAGVAQDAGSVRLVLWGFEGSLGDVTIGVVLPHLMSGGQESLVHEALSLQSVVAGLSLSLAQSVTS